MELPADNVAVNACIAFHQDRYIGKLYLRIRSRQLRLWGIDKKKAYKNIGGAIAGQIRPEIIDKGWRGILWILASIEGPERHHSMERLVSGGNSLKN